LFGHRFGPVVPTHAVESTQRGGSALAVLTTAVQPAGQKKLVVFHAAVVAAAHAPLVTVAGVPVTPGGVVKRSNARPLSLVQMRSPLTRNLVVSLVRGVAVRSRHLSTLTPLYVTTTRSQAAAASHSAAHAAALATPEISSCALSTGRPSTLAASAQ
jgi:hypothetical protein